MKFSIGFAIHANNKLLPHLTAKLFLPAFGIIALMANGITTRIDKREAAQFWSTITISGIVIYIAVDVVLAFLRPDYSLLRSAESDYGRGPYFWLMDINFILRCLLSLALVAALFLTFPKNKSVKRANYWLIIWAIASGLLAFFADNPHGYPKLQSGLVHGILGLIDFFAAMVAMVLFSKLVYKMKPRRVVVYTLIVLTVIAFITLLLMEYSSHKVAYSQSLEGLFERIFLGSVLAFEAILALSIKSRNRTLSHH